MRKSSVGGTIRLGDLLDIKGHTGSQRQDSAVLPKVMQSMSSLIWNAGLPRPTAPGPGYLLLPLLWSPYMFFPFHFHAFALAGPLPRILFPPVYKSHPSLRFQLESYLNPRAGARFQGQRWMGSKKEVVSITESVEN